MMMSTQPRSGSAGGMYPYDPFSQQTVNAIPGIHKSGTKLSEEITRTVCNLSQHVESLRSDLHGNVSYEQFIGDMMFPDETMLVNQQCLPYAYITFQHLLVKDGAILPNKKTMTQGRAFLTNRRLILLSNEGTQRSEVSAVGPMGANAKPSKYMVKCESGDAFHFQFLPLDSILAVEFDAMIGASMATFVNSREACSLLKMCSWFGHAMCLRNWYELGRIANPSVNQRLLRLSVNLPPWGTPCYVEIYVQPHVALQIVNCFLADLQAHAPSMKSQVFNKTT